MTIEFNVSCHSGKRKTSNPGVHDLTISGPLPAWEGPFWTPPKMLCWKVLQKNKSKKTKSSSLLCFFFRLPLLIYKPVSCITSFLSYCDKHVVSTSFPQRNHKDNLDRYSSVAGPEHVRNSSNTVPPRLALQSKWPKASSNIEERKGRLCLQNQ